ncbi:hypothetical protein BAE44_0000289 [Dichanthelium oligosanthes]|uniref:Uncharacterized protein n=1 Tax=Dichanthelium oligosanthes TaxID=888268 RepID=A0A1E5WMS8_9POAL|nr:hypothetical protein BAE44_0000289 [Dichanthelium oligosanthes]
MCSLTSFSYSLHTPLASFVLPSYASIGTPSSLTIASSTTFRRSMDYLYLVSSRTPLASPDFSLLGILLTVSQQHLSLYQVQTSTGMSLVAAAAMSFSLIQLGVSSLCGTL